jgi:hypothetical protein
MSPHTVTGVRTGWMFDSVQDLLVVVLVEIESGRSRMACRSYPMWNLLPRVRTFHETLLDDLTQPLHVSFWQVLAGLCLLQPFVGSGTL